MKEFYYQALDQQKRLRQGVIKARDLSEASIELAASGLLLTNLEAAVTRSGSEQFASPARRSRPMASAEAAHFLIELALLRRSGMDFARALDFMVKTASTKSKKAALRDLLSDVRKGLALSESLERADRPLPSFAIYSLKAAEAAGEVDAMLQQIGTHFERRAKVLKEFQSAIVYPAFLLVFAAVVIIVVLTVLVPQVRDLFPEGKDRIPPLLGSLMWLSDALHGYWPIVVAGVLGFGLYIKRQVEFGARSLYWSRYLLTSRLIGGPLRLKHEIASFARLLSLLSRSGIRLDAAMTLCKNAAHNVSFAAALGGAAQQVSRGETLHAALRAQSLFPDLALDLVHVGEEASSLPDCLDRLAELCEADVQSQLANLMTLLVPVLTLLIGSLVGFVIYAVFTALLGINELALQ